MAAPPDRLASAAANLRRSTCPSSVSPSRPSSSASASASVSVSVSALSPAAAVHLRLQFASRALSSGRVSPVSPLRVAQPAGQRPPRSSNPASSLASSAQPLTAISPPLGPSPPPPRRPAPVSPRLPPSLLALLAAAALLAGYEWYRRQLQDELDEWTRYQSRQQRSSAGSIAPVEQRPASSALPPARAVPAWCDTDSKVELWRLSERLLAATDQVAPPSIERAILASAAAQHSHTAHPLTDIQTAIPLHADAHATFVALQSSLSALQSALQSEHGQSTDKQPLLATVSAHLAPLQRSLVLIALHPLLPPAIRSQSLALIDSLSSRHPPLSESLVAIAGSALIGHVAHHSPISPSLFIAYQRTLQRQQDAFHQQQLLDSLVAQSSAHWSSSPVGSGLCEIDELLSLLKSMPNLHRHLHVYLHRQQQDEGAGAESTLPSLHPSLAKEDLDVLNRVPIELTSRPPVTHSTAAATALATAGSAVSTLVTAFLARYTYSYNAVQLGMQQQLEQRRVDDHFHAMRLLASMCEQREVCQYLMDRGLIPLLARWYERGGLSREMRVKVQLARLVANANSHPAATQLADICLHSPLILELVDWAHSDPLQSDDHFLPLNLPIPAEATDLSTALARDTPPPASASFPATLPTRDTLTAQRAVEALSTFRHSAPARLHQLRQDVVASISALSSSLPPAVRSRLPSPTSSLPSPSPPITQAELASAGSGASSSGQHTQPAVKPTLSPASSPPRVGSRNDSHSSLLNVLTSQAVRALANLYAQMERRREDTVCAAAEQWRKQQQHEGGARTKTDGDDGGDKLWEVVLSKGRKRHPLYSDEVYLIHPAFVPLSSSASPPSAQPAPLSHNMSPHSPPPLWYPATPVADLVFVHGLLGNPLRTWRLHTSHDDKAAAKDEQKAAVDAVTREVDTTETQLIAHYTTHLRDLLAGRTPVTNTAKSDTRAALSAPDTDTDTAEDVKGQHAPPPPAARRDTVNSSATGDVGDGEGEEGEEERDSQSSDAEIIWPRDWLPSALPENVRILSIGFRSSLLHEQDSTGNSLVDRAEQFIHKLQLAAVPTDAHSASATTATAAANVIWITHSMGGLLAKQMLYASPSLLSSTLGLVFLATPHAGAWLPKNSTTRALFGYIATPSVELDQLEENSPHLLQLNRFVAQHVAQQQQRLRVLSVGEGQPTPLPPNRPTSPFSLLLVPSKSSNPGYGEWMQLDEENHLNICKPHNKDSSMFRTVVAFVRERIQTMHALDAQRMGATAQEGVEQSAGGRQ